MTKCLKFRFVLCMVVLFGALGAHAEECSFNENCSIEISSEICEDDGGGGIVMVDIVTLYVYTDDENSEIESLEIFNFEWDRVYFQRGCNDHDCTYDVGDLVPGTYYVIAYIEEGEPISDVIEKE